MKRKHFYSHLIDWQEVYVSLDELDLSHEEKKELAELAEGNLHHTVIDAVLSELQEHDKELFVKLIQHGEHDQTWEFLDKRVLNIEDKITKVSETLKIEMSEDIKIVKEDSKKK